MENECLANYVRINIDNLVSKYNLTNCRGGDLPRLGFGEINQINAGIKIYSIIILLK